MKHCPDVIVNDMFGKTPMGNSVERFFSRVVERVPNVPWYFGHWHEDKDWGRFHCLYDRILHPFITLFSVLFLLLYSPFSSTYWLTLSSSYLLLGTVVLYAVSVLFLLLSKFLLIEINRKHAFGLFGILAYFISEVLVISLFYTVISILVNKCQDNAGQLFMKSFLCVFLEAPILWPPDAKN